MSKYEVAVVIELELDDTGVNVNDETQQDAQFELAFQQADVIMQRAWDTDQGRHHVRKWHFSMLEGAVTAVEEPATH